MLSLAYQSVNSSAHLDTNMRLSDLQMSSIMTMTTGSKIDAIKSLQHCTFMRNKSQSKLVTALGTFWMTPKFQSWNSTGNSSLIMIKGLYASRFDVRDFCVDAITLLRDSKVPVLWALKSIKHDAEEAPSVVDLLKDLVSQALRLNDALHSERSMALTCTKFQRAQTEIQWLELLGSVLAGLPLVYIIIDVEVVSPRLQSLDTAFSWPTAFLDFFQKLPNHGCKSVVKVVLVSHGSSMFVDTATKDLQDLVISVGRPQKIPLAARSRTGSLRGSWSRRAAFGRGRTWGLTL